MYNFQLVLVSEKGWQWWSSSSLSLSPSIHIPPYSWISLFSSTDFEREVINFFVVFYRCSSNIKCHSRPLRQLRGCSPMGLTSWGPTGQSWVPWTLRTLVFMKGNHKIIKDNLQELEKEIEWILFCVIFKYILKKQWKAILVGSPLYNN